MSDTEQSVKTCEQHVKTQGELICTLIETVGLLAEAVKEQQGVLRELTAAQLETNGSVLTLAGVLRDSPFAARTDDSNYPQKVPNND